MNHDLFFNKEENLFYYSKIGDLDRVKFFVNLGADIHYEDDICIWFAAQNGHFEIVRYFVEKGIKTYPLSISAEKGHLEIVRYLVEKGANIHFCEDAALRYSAEKGHLEIVRYLVEKGANIHARQDYALKNSLFWKHLNVYNYLKNL